MYNSKVKRDHNSSAEIRLRELLRAKRQEKGVTQLALSMALDNTCNFVFKYESGERFLTFTEVVLICQHLDIDPLPILQEIALCTTKSSAQQE